MLGYTQQECFSCKVQYWIPDSLEETKQKTRNNENRPPSYCPYGHANYRKPEAVISQEQKIRQERDQLLQNKAYLQDRINEEREGREAAERSAKAYRASATRVKNRAKHGVCPCCNRTFKQLAAHMKTQHPGYKPDADVIDLAKKVRERG